MRQVLGSTHTFSDRFSIFDGTTMRPLQIVGPSAGGFSLSTVQTTLVNTQTLTLAGCKYGAEPTLIEHDPRELLDAAFRPILHPEFVWGATPLNPSLLLGPVQVARVTRYFMLLIPAICLSETVE